MKWPEKMKSPSNSQDSRKWCEFHNDHGHRMDECVALRLEVSELLKQGHLKDPLTKKGQENQEKISEHQGEQRAPTSQAQPQTEWMINVISGG